MKTINSILLFFFRKKNSKKIKRRLISKVRWLRRQKVYFLAQNQVTAQFFLLRRQKV